jgi:hypothetical protein
VCFYHFIDLEQKQASLQCNVPCFQAPYSIIVKANSSIPYPVVFSPKRQCDVYGKLLLTIIHTGQKYSYQLHGVGEDPLPESHLKIQGVVRERVTLQFSVKNYSDRNVEYEVLTDIQPEIIVQGWSLETEKASAARLANIIVAAGQCQTYNLDLQLNFSGLFKNTVTFVSKADQSFVWYTAEVT